jgi:hypothetical protein
VDAGLRRYAGVVAAAASLRSRSRVIGAIAICGVVAACGLPYGAGPLSGDLRSARQACNEAYPRRVGNYLPHARCVNAAVEAYALSAARYPDLIRLQEELRASLSEKIDRHRLSAQAGERQMAEADNLIKETERERDKGNQAAASHRMEKIEAMLR